MTALQILLLYFTLLLVPISTTVGFGCVWRLSSSPRRRHSHQHHGIAEWRDTFFDVADDDNDSNNVMPVKEVCVLPFSFQEVQLQGETRQLRLYEDRFIQLFEDAMHNHSGVVAMGFIMENEGLLQTIPLAEIEAYNRMDGEFGIFLTVRVVGRARMMDVIQTAPYIKATCREIVDEISPHREKRNSILDEIEQHLVLLSKLEHDLKTNDNESKGPMSTTFALLEDKFDYDEDDDEEEDERPVDRRRRFHWAYKEALNSDTQGYQTSLMADTENTRTEREITAASWAVFNTDLVPDAEDLVFRIRALDCSSLDNRLRLGRAFMRRKRTTVTAKIGEIITTGLNLTDTSDDV